LTTAWRPKGKQFLYVVAEGRLVGAVAVEDEIRPDPMKRSWNFIAWVSGRD